jgi:geranylgeranyl reductase family protein
MQEIITTEVAIVGAGPAGTSCALHLAAKGIACVLIDKAIFPRDKICGDAISGNSIYEIEKLGLDFPQLFKQFEQKLPTAGIKFIAPSGRSLFLKMKKIREGFTHAGYVSKRIDYDYFLFEQAKKNNLIQILEGVHISDTDVQEEGMLLKTKDEKTVIRAKMAVGADGAHSILAKLTGREMDKTHYSGGLRQYWENVTGFDEGGPIELHFYKKTLPGYFWVFPMQGNRANVGIGIKSDVIAKKRINLKLMMDGLIKEHPLLKERFKNARPLEEPKGFGLPLGSKKISLSGERFILLGDAASLIDPFTGEGIGNAMVSGRIAATHIEQCLLEKRFDAGFNRHYDEAIYKKLSNELNISHQLQKMLGRPWLFNLLVKKANTNQHLHGFLEDLLDDPNQRKQITRLSFYYKLVFNPKSKH